MKKYLLITLAALLAFSSCNKPEKDPTENETPTVKLEITGIENNQATITATMTAGKFYGGKIIAGKKVNNLPEDFDYTKDIQLINYVKANGTEITEMPTTVTLENLTFEKDYFSAVVVYGKDGLVCSSAYETWTAQGNPDGIADNSSAGNLDDNQLN